MHIQRLGAVLVAVSALVLTGCTAAVESSATTASGAAEPSSSAALGSAATAAKAVVDQVTAPVGPFTAPGPALTGVDAVKGKTVYYVPATLQVPMFGTIRDALSDAFGQVGVTVQTCDGKANPADIANCLGQAVNGQAAAVIAGSIPNELATTAFKSVTDAGIPLVYMQTAPAGPGDPTKVGYLTENNIEMSAWNSNWVIADSDAKANVLVIKVTDTPATIMWTDLGALAAYEQACPECTVTIIETNTGQLDKLPSLVSSALIKDPAIGYVHVAFDVTVQPTIQGIQSANRNDVKIVTKDGTLPVMQSLKAGQVVATDVGFNQEALAWYGADQALRMMTGQPSNQNVNFPYRRMFTRDIVGDLDISQAGEQSGDWYGDATFVEGFINNWGLS